MLVLTHDVLEKYIQKHPTLMNVIKDYEKYIIENGLPYLDYKLYRSNLFYISPIRKFQQGVRRIMRIMQSYKSDASLNVTQQSIVQEKMTRFQRRRNTIHPNNLHNIVVKRHDSSSKLFVLIF